MVRPQQRELRLEDQKIEPLRIEFVINQTRRQPSHLLNKIGPIIERQGVPCRRFCIVFNKKALRTHKEVVEALIIREMAPRRGRGWPGRDAEATPCPRPWQPGRAGSM